MTVIDEMNNMLLAKKYDNFYVRKKYAVLDAYQGKMFNKISTIYPEIHDRMIDEGNWEIRNMFGKFPALTYYLSRFNYYCHCIIK